MIVKTNRDGSISIIAEGTIDAHLLDRFAYGVASKVFDDGGRYEGFPVLTIHPVKSVPEEKD